MTEMTKKLYLDLLKKTLTDLIYCDVQETPSLLPLSSGEEQRVNGLDIPYYAHTMIGLKRLDNLQFCIDEVLANEIPGDLIETGVWRGGAAIFMRAVLKANDENQRLVWAADSFTGLPNPDTNKYPADAESRFHEFEFLAVSLERVQANFAKYDLLDEQVKFLKGWFKDTLPGAAIKELAVIRLDGDMYESTIDALRYLYPKLSSGGYLIVDDYGCVSSCRQAVDDYRLTHNITEEIKEIDWTGIYWQKS
jgi:O-methyltransferase